MDTIDFLKSRCGKMLKLLQDLRSTMILYIHQMMEFLAGHLKELLIAGPSLADVIIIERTQSGAVSRCRASLAQAGGPLASGTPFVLLRAVEPMLVGGGPSGIGVAHDIAELDGGIDNGIGDGKWSP